MYHHFPQNDQDDAITNKNKTPQTNSDSNVDSHTKPVSDSNEAPSPPGRQFSDLSDSGSLVVVDGPYGSNNDLQNMSLSSTYTSYCDLEWTPSMRGLSRIDYSCPVCNMLMQEMKCEDTKQFWREIDETRPDETQKCHIKFFVKFLERLKEKFPQEDGLKSKETINLLKYLLNIDLKDELAEVKLTMVKRLTGLFGPIREEDNKCVLVNRLFQLLKRSSKIREATKTKTSWFVGEMSRDEAETMLLGANCKDNSFLVRISGNDGSDGDFALSVRHNDHCHHLKIQGSPEKSLAETPYHAHLKFAGRDFKSLPDVVDYIIESRTINLDITHEDGESGSCKSVSCLRVFPLSPLNVVISGYETAKQ